MKSRNYILGCTKEDCTEPSRRPCGYSCPARPDGKGRTKVFECDDYLCMFRQKAGKGTK